MSEVNVTSLKALKLKTDKKMDKLVLVKLLEKDLEKVVLPSEIDVIGEDAFRNAKKLKEVVLNEGLSEIGEDAFCGCVSLTSVEIPSSVTKIAEDTFSGCSSLESVVIPSSVTLIEEDAFEGCEKLSKVIYLGSEEQWNLVDIAKPNDCLLKAEVKCQK